MFTLGGGGRSTLNFWSDFCNCNFSVLTSENVHLRWGGSIDTQLQLFKWLCNCNFSVLTSENVHLRWWWWGGRSTLNFWSDFANATFLYSPLEMFTLGGGGGSIGTQLLKWLCKCNFSVLTSGNVHLRWGGSIDTQLLKWLCNCNFSVLTSGNVHLGGSINTPGTNVQFSQIPKYSLVWTFLSCFFSLVHKIKIQTWLQT